MGVACAGPSHRPHRRLISTRPHARVNYSNRGTRQMVTVLVDTLGLLLSTAIHPADIQGRDGALPRCSGRRGAGCSRPSG
jgi:hypothetical protein